MKHLFKFKFFHILSRNLLCNLSSTPELSVSIRSHLFYLFLLPGADCRIFYLARLSVIKLEGSRTPGVFLGLNSP